jgi:hypothetical protein
MKYNPLRAPDPVEWLDLDERQRIDLIVDYHRLRRIKLESIKAHAAIHAAVENQIALKEAPVIAALERLIGDGLDRHDAIHAIGSVLSVIIFDVMKKPNEKFDINKRYHDELAELTVEKWRSDN